MTDELTEFRNTLKQLRDGNQEAAWRLTELFAPHVIRVIKKRKQGMPASKVGTSDFMQMVWQSFFEEREQFERIRTPDDLVRLLVTMARNKVVDEARRQYQTEKYNVLREQPLPGHDASDLADQRSLPEIVAMARECWEQIMTGQPDRNRRIVELRLEGQNYVDIAADLGIHERTVRKVIEELHATHAARLRKSL